MALPISVLILGLVLSFALPIIGIYRRQRGKMTLDWVRLRQMLIRNWGVFFALVIVVLAMGDRSALGFRVPTVGVFIDGLLFGFIAFSGTMLLVAVAFRAMGGVVADEASLIIIEQSVLRRFAVAGTGAVVETVIFYGFALEALSALGVNLWIAGAGAAIGVLLMRAQWSLQNTIQWLPGALVLSAVTIWSGTVIIAVFIRLVYDVLTLVSADRDDYGVLGDNN